MDYRLDEITGSLNPEQVEAVTTTHSGHVLVLAGAGCGKTSVLTRRIAFLQARGTPRERILALTFTRKAADEMAARVRKLDTADHAGPQALITTFHGFALRVLQETVDGCRNFGRIGFRGDARLLSEPERLGILARICTDRERQSLGVDLLGLDALLAKRAVSLEKEHAATAEEGPVAAIDRRLGVEKRNLGLWDFSDLISGVITLFRENAGIAEQYARRFDVVLVDEFQDTNPLQIRLLRMLLAPSTPLFAVGDDDQAIYGFRGADIGPITRFGDCFTNAIIIKLQTNYRSTPAILATANRIFAGKSAAYRKVLRSGRYSGRQPGARPLKRRFATQADMARWILREAERVGHQHGIAPGDMAALFRVNQTLEWTRTFWGDVLSTRAGCPATLTIHGSKGLEFPVVFLCDLEEGVFPSYRLTSRRAIATWPDLLRYIFRKRTASSPECDWGEERRLFYVGVTRAERFLYLLTVSNKQVYGRKRRFRPSRFLRIV